MSRIQNKQDLDLERDPALRHSPAIMHQESGFLGINHALSSKQASSLELQEMQRESGKEGKGEGGIKKYKWKRIICVWAKKMYEMSMQRRNYQNWDGKKEKEIQ